MTNNYEVLSEQKKDNYPKVSVIMPTFNVEKYLKAAIDSILAQTYADFELIIVDDNSTDKTREIVQSYTDKRIMLIDGPCRGIAAALNKGMKMATGEYIARMDADDISLPQRLEKQVFFLEKHRNVGICGTFATKIDEYGKKIANVSGLIENPTIIDALFSCILVHPSVMFRRNVVEKYDLYYNEDFLTAEDQELWARALKVTQVCNLPEYLFFYREHGSNVSYVKKEAGLKIEQKIRLNILNWLHYGNYDASALDRIYLLDRAFKKLEQSENDICLFGYIKLLRRKIKKNTVSYMLLSIIPLLTVKYKRNAVRYLLFGILPVFKIR